MADLNKLYQSADWKKEKHSPVIEILGSPVKGEPFDIKLMIGKEIAHPNTTEHHIRWIKALFLPEGEKFPYELGRFEFNAHGESVEGPDTSTVYTEPATIVSLKTEKPGTLMAFSYCNIHGLWQSEKKINF